MALLTIAFFYLVGCGLTLFIGSLLNFICSNLSMTTEDPVFDPAIIILMAFVSYIGSILLILLALLVIICNTCPNFINWLQGKY